MLRKIWLLWKYIKHRLYVKFLLWRYKNKIVLGLQDEKTVMDKMSKIFNFKKITYKDVDENFWKYLIIDNVKHLPCQDYNFGIYKLVKDEKSEAIYKKGIKEDPLYEHSDIYIVFENNNHFVNSNCWTLLLKIIIEQGIKEEEYNDNKSLKLLEYLIRFDEYNKSKFWKNLLYNSNLN